jgi:hypothetical protein
MEVGHVVVLEAEPEEFLTAPRRHLAACAGAARPQLHEAHAPAVGADGVVP